MKILFAAVLMLGLAPLAAHAEDMTGAWSGAYSERLDSGDQTVPFEANINAHGSTFTGMTREPNRSDTNDAALFAVLSGSADGARVSFIKTYGSSGWNHSIQYAGRFVSADRVEGTWTLDKSSGSFVMTRH